MYYDGSERRRERERGGGERDGNGSRIWKEGGAAEERGGGGMPGGGATGEGDRGIWVGGQRSLLFLEGERRAGDGGSFFRQ